MHWCRRWSVPDADVADVFQEVFRAVAVNIEKFRKEQPQDTFRGWLRTITRNKVYDHYQRLGREPRGVGGTDVQRRIAEVPGPPALDDLDDDQPDDETELAARDGLVHRALEQIRSRFEEKTWRAFWRTAVDGQSAIDVADELSMSPGAVRVAKSRVLQRLRDELGELIE
jgi:RNA polymerase sigma-70 factor (ECF subfamily)